MTTTATMPEQESASGATKPPFLRRVRIKGYKSIAHCDVRFQPLTILVGRNGSGKSNFLDALAFLRDVMELNLPEAVRRRGGWQAIACRTAETPSIEFEVETAFSYAAGMTGSQADRLTATALYSLTLTSEALSGPAIARESLEVSCHPGGLRAGYELESGVLSSYRATPESQPPIALPHSAALLDKVRVDRPLLAAVGSQPFVGLADGIRLMGFYSIHPDAIRRLQHPNPGQILERDGGNLASSITSIREVEEDTVERIRDYLRVINRDVKGFEVVRLGEYETVRFEILGEGQKAPVCFDASCMSDGTLRALAALVAAFQITGPMGPTVIGIEEPETSLHPAAMQALVDAMDEATLRTQVILTTHSPDLLEGRGLKPEQIMAVRAHAGKTLIGPLDRASLEIIEKELVGVADLHRMDKLDTEAALNGSRGGG